MLKDLLIHQDEWIKEETEENHMRSLKQEKFDVFKRFMDDAFALFKDGRRHPSLDMVDDEMWMLQYLGVLTDSENPEEDTEGDSSSTDL
ncbi:unnamed protein product [Darwinula stevensoni]|uniref:Uncharacterized protein n=1 Tax=Darwinula stevensoni TaxID=69355 RepID=A0A7R9FRB9_9CRUS|nr:unnamed protein product [Darwinula stevensoni]CAG0901119.1 unnamed protein product [Darwinula stevensoni]